MDGVGCGVEPWLWVELPKDMPKRFTHSGATWVPSGKLTSLWEITFFSWKNPL